MNEHLSHQSDTYPSRYFVAGLERAAALKQAAAAIGPFVTFTSFRFKSENVHRFAANYLSSEHLLDPNSPESRQAQEFGDSLLHKYENGDFVAVILHGPDLNQLDTVSTDADALEAASETSISAG